MKENTWNYHEKKSVLIAIMSVVVGVIYFSYILSIYNNIENVFQFWAGAMIGFLPLFIILQAIALWIFENRQKDFTPKIVDERDKSIELRANQIEHYIISIGIFIAGLLAFLTGFIEAFFIPLIIAMILSSIISNLFRYHLYK